MESKIQFFNTLTGRVELFDPIEPHQVKMYTCGPTVYDYAHIGNFRTFVFEDLLRRFLEFKGYDVKHVMNLTDVDDKTIAGALKTGKTLQDYTEFYAKAFFEDLSALHILRPNHPQNSPKATAEIPAMIELIEKLIAKKAAYPSEDGSVYFRVSAFPAYGKLSKKRLDQNIQGARVDSDEYEKEEGADFVLWKKAKEGEPSWNSPWGEGRPGWHIECSAMSMKYLGRTFDIHAGGEDLIFPHHENEIAQSEASTGELFSRYWLHCRFLLVEGEKMSKSKGNFFTLRDLMAKGYDPAAVRYVLLATHYRSQLNFTLSNLEKAEEMIKKMDDCYFQCLSYWHDREELTSADRSLTESLRKSEDGMLAALADDLNIAVSLAEYFEGIKLINKMIAEKTVSEINLKAALNFFENADRLFGFGISADKEIPEPVWKQMIERHSVRANSEFKKDKKLQGRSDALRDALAQSGWLVRDAKPGERSTLKRKRRVWDR